MRSFEVTNEAAIIKAEFEETGILGPVSVLTPNESHRMKRLLASAPAPIDWGKGRAASSPAFYEMARHAAIVDRVAEIIGDDVMVWGSPPARIRIATS